MNNKELEMYEDCRKWGKFGRILSGFIHNINTPLMGISGRVELLGLVEPNLKGLNQITKQIQKLDDAIKNLTVIIENEKNNIIQDINLKDFIDSLHNFFLSDMKYKHKLKINNEWNNNIIIKNINVNWLQNVLYELINNSIEACETGNIISIRTEKMGKKAVIYIEDSAKKINPEDVSKIFEYGYSTKGQSGVGLNIVKDYLRKLGGTLDLVLGKNRTIFKIIL